MQLIPNKLSKSEKNNKKTKNHNVLKQFHFCLSFASKPLLSPLYNLLVAKLVMFQS